MPPFDSGFGPARFPPGRKRSGRHLGGQAEARGRLVRELACRARGAHCPGRGAARSGRGYLGFHLLHSAGAQVRALALVQAKRATARKNEEAFEREWRATGEAIAEAERRLEAAAGSRRPAVVRALAHVARQESGPYYEGGRLYGLNTTFEDGLYYVGLAEAQIAYALFLHSLDVPSARAGPAFPPLAQEIARLDGEVVKAYQTAGQADQRRYIEINVALKVASECERRGWREGALYKTLDAARLFGLLSAAPVDAPAAAALRSELGRSRAMLEAGPADHSIAILFVEMAQSALDEAAAGETDRAREAAVVARLVIPLYTRLVPGAER